MSKKRNDLVVNLKRARSWADVRDQWDHPAENAERPTKRARIDARSAGCDPAKGKWCLSCQVAMGEAQLKREILTLDAATTLSNLARTTEQCPYFLTAYVTALGLKRQPGNTLVELESVSDASGDEEDAVMLDADADADAEDTVDFVQTEAELLPLVPTAADHLVTPPTPPLVLLENSEPSEAPRPEQGPEPALNPEPELETLVLLPIPSVPDEDELPDETPEERLVYEQRFDRAYGHLTRVPRDLKRDIRTRLWPFRGFQKRNVHPNELRVYMDPGPHVYLIDKDATNTISVSTYLKRFFTEFDAKAQAEKSVGRGRTAACTSSEQVLATWDRARNNGTAFHAAMENAARVQRDRLFQFETSDLVAEAPPGFYIFLRDHPYLAFYRCEMTLFDEASRICGQADALMMDTRNDDIWLIDYKNTNGIYQRGFKGAVCRHPMTLGLPDCNYTKYDFQVNAYRHMIEHTMGLKVARQILLNFKPVSPVDAPPEILEIPRRDMTQFFQSRAAELAAQ